MYVEIKYNYSLNRYNLYDTNHQRNTFDVIVHSQYFEFLFM